VKTNCLSCKYYKIKDTQSGLCRMEALTSGNREAKKPKVDAEDHCEKWINCGQTYYIRLGWIKSNSPEAEKE